MKKNSMKEIAAELGLSITTVSFVLNGKAAEMGIKEATVKKVNDLITKKFYSPNGAARGLRTGKSNAIMLIVEDISNPFFANIAKYLEIVANKNGYKVFFGNTDNKLEIATGLISSMRQGIVDGFIITPTKGLEEEVLRLEKDEIPFVLIDRALPAIKVDSVILDNFYGGYQLTQHLLQNGYSKIAFFTVSDVIATFEQRKEGYISALQDYKIPVDEGLVWQGNFGEPDAVWVASIQAFMAANKTVDAVLFAANYIGILGLKALQLSKIKIGKDVAMVSFDDNDVFRLISPAVTVAAQPMEEMAVTAFERLLAKIKKPDMKIPPVQTMLQPQIIVRKSSPIKK